MLQRRQRIGLFATVAIVALVALAWLGWWTAPAAASNTIVIASVQNLEVDSGLPNAVVFPFELAPGAQPDEEGIPGVSSATISVAFTEPACQVSTSHPCPGVAVAVLIGGPTGTAATLDPLWCQKFANGTTCAPTANGTAQVDLSDYAGQPLDLIVWTPTGVAWTDLTATGTWVSN